MASIGGAGAYPQGERAQVLAIFDVTTRGKASATAHVSEVARASLEAEREVTGKVLVAETRRGDLAGFGADHTTSRVHLEGDLERWATFFERMARCCCGCCCRPSAAAVAPTHPAAAPPT